MRLRSVQRCTPQKQCPNVAAARVPARCSRTRRTSSVHCRSGRPYHALAQSRSAVVDTALALVAVDVTGFARAWPYRTSTNFRAAWMTRSSHPRLLTEAKKIVSEACLQHVQANDCPYLQPCSGAAANECCHCATWSRHSCSNAQIACVLGRPCEPSASPGTNPLPERWRP